MVKISFLLVITLLLQSSFLKASSPDKGKFRKSKNGTYVIAHRGAHNGIPENTIAAYQQAIDLGCDFVEIDVRTTKDGKFVSVHNPDINHYVTGGKGQVKDMTLEELGKLDVGEKVGSQWKNTRIPTFEEILKLCKGKIGIYLDLKDAPVDELMKIIRKFDMEDDIVWYISASSLMQMPDPDRLFGASYIMPDPGVEENLVSVITKLKPTVIASDMGVLSKSFVDKCHSFQVKVFVDDYKETEAEWQQMLDWGVDGIQTDKPQHFINFIKQHN